MILTLLFNRIIISIRHLCVSLALQSLYEVDKDPLRSKGNAEVFIWNVEAQKCRPLIKLLVITHSILILIH